MQVIKTENLDRIARNIYAIFAENLGVTYDVNGFDGVLDSKAEVFVVSLPGHEVKFEMPTFGLASIKAYIEGHAAALEMPGNYLGIWYNGDDKTVYVDVSEVFKDGDAAIAAAIERKQLAIWDNANAWAIAVAHSL